MKKPSESPFTIEWKGLTFTGTAVYYPGDPGRTSGPPEKCYPPEPPEIEVTSMKCGRYDAMFLFDEEDLANEICDLVMASYQEEPDGPEYEPSDMSDVEADADTLRSAGMGTDEDYGYFGETE